MEERPEGSSVSAMMWASLKARSICKHLTVLLYPPDNPAQTADKAVEQLMQPRKAINGTAIGSIIN